jgi:hypothetical protein
MIVIQHKYGVCFLIASNSGRLPKFEEIFFTFSESLMYLNRRLSFEMAIFVQQRKKETQLEREREKLFSVHGKILF